MDSLWTPANIDVARFSDWLSESEIFASPYSEKTKRVYLSVVSGFVLFLAQEGIRSFADFNVPWVRRFVTRNAETGNAYSQSYQTLRLSALKIFWHWLIENGVINNNPAADLIKERLDHKRDSARPYGGKPPKRLPVVLGWSDQRILLNAVQQTESRVSIRDCALISLVLASGLRSEELCNMRVHDLDLQYRRLRVTGKGRKERIVDFSHDCQATGNLEMWLHDREDILRMVGQESDLLFISITGRALTESLVYYTVAKYLRLAGLRKRTRYNGAHLLRHTATSIMFARNVPLLQIMANLGHDQIKTTQIYAHLLPDETGETMLRH